MMLNAFSLLCLLKFIFFVFYFESFLISTFIFYIHLVIYSCFMRIIVQRVFQAWVRVGGIQISRTKEGILVLVGLTPGDTLDVVQHMANKVLNMRLWEKDGKSWNASVVDIKGDVMAVSQFTLYGILKGNKPDFHSAMQADKARQMFDLFVQKLKKKYDPTKIQTGKFQHLMEVGSINNGPVTIQYEKLAEEKRLKTKMIEKNEKKVQNKNEQKEQTKEVKSQEIKQKLQKLELNEKANIQQTKVQQKIE